jgi:hypothetical protein
MNEEGEGRVSCAIRGARAARGPRLCVETPCPTDTRWLNQRADSRWVGKGCWVGATEWSSRAHGIDRAQEPIAFALCVQRVHERDRAVDYVED